jgi:phosphoribosylformylglycinamidine (FGAM) synthase PurS component
LYYSPSVPPFTLKRVTKVTDPEGKTIQRQTTAEVLAVDMPHKVLDDMEPVAYQRTLETHPNGSTATIEVFCLGVPGGIVAHTSKDMDTAGNVIRRSTLELMCFEVPETRTAPRGFLFHRYRRVPTRPQP